MATVENKRHCRVAIVGGGPAGLAAATRLRALGVEGVLLLEREPEIGGIPRHCGHYPFGLREFRRLLRGPDYARRLAAEARACGAEILTRASVVLIEAGPRLKVSLPDGMVEVSAERVLLSTGVRERSRAARFIGGERPQGVLSTGALQSLVYLKGLRPFSRPVILGSELVSFSALLTCRHAGIRPQAMIEANPRVTARSFARGLPALLGVPLHLGSRLDRILGHERVEGVLLKDAQGKAREIACDGVIVSGGFTPEATLARMGHLEVDPGSGGPAVDQFGRCSDPAYFAAGNLLRPVETAGWSWREGVEAGERIAADLEGSLATEGSEAVAIELAEGPLRFVLPQSFCTPGGALGMRHAQLRAARPATGLLSLSRDGRKLWSRRLSLLPERRILVPLAPLAGSAAGARINLVFEEEG
jgi:NADPH-dependent 2,4-dienoyl-CoA reductase/sulfur reductase-like enzyme